MENTKPIVRINDRISISADSNQYIIKVFERGNTNPSYWFFPTLDMCFQEIFDHLCKERLIVGEEKEIKDIAEIIWKTRKEILEIMEPFVEIKAKP